MALITCPECGGSVSDKATACIHCGYPLQQYNTNNIEEPKFWSVRLNQIIGKNDADCTRNKIDCEITIRTLFDKSGSYSRSIVNNLPSTVEEGITKENAEYAVRDFAQHGGIAEIYPSESQKENIFANMRISNRAINYPIDGKVHCPKCKGTNITTTTKGFGLVRGFVGSGKPVNVCQNCGYKWEL